MCIKSLSWYLDIHESSFIRQKASQRSNESKRVLDFGSRQERGFYLFLSVMIDKDNSVLNLHFLQTNHVQPTCLRMGSRFLVNRMSSLDFLPFIDLLWIVKFAQNLPIQSIHVQQTHRQLYYILCMTALLRLEALSIPSPIFTWHWMDVNRSVEKEVSCMSSVLFNQSQSRQTKMIFKAFKINIPI